MAFVAHDLRTPLSAIALSARVLEKLHTRDRTDDPQATQMWNALNRNVQTLVELVSKVVEENSGLETELGSQLHRREFDLWPMVEGLIHDLHPVAGTSSTRLINTVPEDLVVYADAILMKRTFQNLIANATAHTPHGELVVGATKMGDEGDVECFVRDNGAGIAPERCRIVFDQRETDRENEGGLGLGLAIVKTFVEAHDGVVTLESKLGAGSTFRFTLSGRQQRDDAERVAEADTDTGDSTSASPRVR